MTPMMAVAKPTWEAGRPRPPVIVPWEESGEREVGRKMKIRALKLLMWKARMKWFRIVRRTFVVKSFLLWTGSEGGDGWGWEGVGCGEVGRL